MARKAGSKYSAVPSAAAGDVEMGPESMPTEEEIQEAGVVDGGINDAKINTD
jgi:hypothetical protein